MWRRSSNNYRDEWIAWVVIIALIIAAILTVLFWALVICITWLLIYLAYELTLLVDDIWLKISIWIITATWILLWGSEILHNYWKINKSILDYSVETATELKLKRNKKWNIKVESDYWTLIETKN